MHIISKMDQIHLLVWMSGQLLFLHIALDWFYTVPFHLIDFWNMPFYVIFFYFWGIESYLC